MTTYSKQATLIKAMAHPTRLQILHILSQGEACVCHLTTILQKRQPYVSQQLMVLREADLVQDRRDGVIVFYRLSDERIAQLLETSLEFLRQMGETIELPVIPAPPVGGCPCPKCAQLVACT